MVFHFETEYAYKGIYTRARYWSSGIISIGK